MYGSELGAAIAGAWFFSLAIAAVAGWALIEGTIWLVKFLSEHLQWVG